MDMDAKGYADISGLDFSKGGIPETGKVNKNRQATLLIDRQMCNVTDIMNRVAILIHDLLQDKIDTIVIDANGRTW